jgi:TRAP-type C4-dicarboxylate transport system substrate-binding protein
MLRFIVNCIFAAVLALPTVATAEPIKLKLAFFTSDRTHLYRAAVKQFIDAVNADGKGRFEIEVHLSGSLGQYPTPQSQLLRDGTADIAFIVQPYERTEFPDSAVVELPGLYKDGRECTLVFSHLVAAGLMHGFGKYFVIGAFASEPESIHLRPPVASLADLKSKRIRANNDTEIAILKKFGAIPAFVPINETALAISSGKIDGATVPPVPMIEFGIGRVAPHHYMLGTSCVPLSLLMTMKRLNSLPADVLAIIRKYSGTWLLENYNRINETSTALIMTQLESDSRRTVVYPSKADLNTADVVFKSIVDSYSAENAHNAALVNAARAVVAKIGNLLA